MFKKIIFALLLVIGFIFATTASFAFNYWLDALIFVALPVTLFFLAMKLVAKYGDKL